MTSSEVLAHIIKLPHARATFKQLVKELGSRGASKEDIDGALDRLTDNGDVIEITHVKPEHSGSS